jgi:RNA polymerase sigma-70 factor (ECF subfamily)
VEQARGGDEEAFGELVRMYHQRVYGVVYGIVRNAEDAKELAQQTWVKAWSGLASFKGRAAFFTWVYRIASFVSLDHLRKLKRRKESEWLDGVELPREPGAGLPESANPRPDRSLLRREVREQFEKALAKLSPEHRAALVLREVEGLSYLEIAEAMNCRKGTVMSRIHYARKRIQQEMKELV